MYLIALQDGYFGKIRKAGEVFAVADDVTLPAWTRRATAEEIAAASPASATATAQSGIVPRYKEYYEFYVPASELIGQIGNSQFVEVRFPKPLSAWPDMFEAVLNIQDVSVRVQYVQSLTLSGFSVATNYGASLQGVWYRVGIKA